MGNYAFEQPLHTERMEWIPGYNTKFKPQTGKLLKILQLRRQKAKKKEAQRGPSKA